MENWVAYNDQDPPDELMNKIVLIRVESVVDGQVYEQEAKWAGTCFMEEDEPGSWVGPIRVVTHWKKL